MPSEPVPVVAAADRFVGVDLRSTHAGAAVGEPPRPSVAPGNMRGGGGRWIPPSLPFDREAVEPSERLKPGGKKPRRHRSAASGVRRLPESAQRSKAIKSSPYVLTFVKI
jgi:hypothetical protein